MRINLTAYARVSIAAVIPVHATIVLMIATFKDCLLTCIAKRVVPRITSSAKYAYFRGIPVDSEIACAPTKNSLINQSDLRYNTLMESNEYEALFKSESDHWWFASLRSKIFRIVSSRIIVGRKIHVFDAGCGTGFLAMRLSDIFTESLEVDCCEPSPNGRLAANRYGIFPMSATISELPCTLHGQYDVVTCIDVLYHRDVEPCVAVRKLSDLLKPGGTLIVNTASLPCLRRAHDDRVHGGRRFTRAQIHKIIEQQGLVTLENYYWNIHLAPIVYAYGLLERLLGGSFGNSSDVHTPPHFLNSFLLLLSKAESLLPTGSPIILRPFGTSIFLVAEKPL